MIGMMILSLIGFWQLNLDLKVSEFSLKYSQFFHRYAFWKMFSSNSLPIFSFIRSISQISREVFLLVERICWVFSLRLNIEVNLVLLIDMEETGAGEPGSLWLVHTAHTALWLAGDWRISPGDHSSFSLHHHLSAPLNSCEPSLKLYLYEKSKISNNPVCLCVNCRTSEDWFWRNTTNLW